MCRARTRSAHGVIERPLSHTRWHSLTSACCSMSAIPTAEIRLPTCCRYCACAPNVNARRRSVRTSVRVAVSMRYHCMCHLCHHTVLITPQLPIVAALSPHTYIRFTNLLLASPSNARIIDHAAPLSSGAELSCRAYCAPYECLAFITGQCIACHLRCASAHTHALSSAYNVESIINLPLLHSRPQLRRHVC